jgi:phage/plasmid-like protein (TIGR03299 family)
MGHGITSTDGVFAVREPMWHNLGDVLSDYPTRAEAKAIAHPWEPMTLPLYRKVPVITSHVHDTSCVIGECDLQDDIDVVYEEVDSHVEVVRDDTGENIGVITSTLEVVTNDEMYDIAEAIQGEGADVKFESGGSLYGGRKVWLLLRLNEPIELRGDPNGAVLPYYALQNDHGGKGAFRGQSLMTRIVCDNTSRLADLEAERRGTEFVFRHTKNVREKIEEAKAALAGWRESVEQWRRIQDHLIGVPVTEAQRDLFIEQFVPMPPPHVVSDRVVTNVEEARAAIRSILAGPTCAEIDLTAYGLVQASIEYLQHHRRARSAESRFKRAYLSEDRLITDAVDLAEQVTLA